MYSTYNRETQERTYYDGSGNVIEVIKVKSSVSEPGVPYNFNPNPSSIPWTPILIGVGAVALIWIIAS